MQKKTLLLSSFLVVGCYAGVESDFEGDELKRDEADIIVENLQLAGFPDDDIMVTDDGRVIVGRDAVVTMQASRELAGITTDGPEGDFRQYRTTATVDTTSISTICVNEIGNWDALNHQALTAAVANYNNEGLQFTMVLNGGNACDATIEANLDNSGGGVAGFPSNGNPYHEFFIGSSIAGNSGVQVSAHVMTHELGHCVGFRHTDYYNRSISCGGQNSNEGDAGVGAIHIPGTPTDAVLNGSVMNSCYNSGSDGQWTAGDVTALDCLYDTGSCAPPPPPPYATDYEYADQSAGNGSETAYGPYDASAASAVRISTAGGSGDADLYVRFGSAPTTNNYDCRPYVGGNNESCEFNPSQSGEYYVMVRAFSAYSGVTVTVESVGGVTEGGAGDGGDGGGAVCGDGTCDPGESCDGRNGTTSCSADCDGRTKGKPSNRYCYVGGVCEGQGCP